ncbi:hypothetical protein Tco_1578804, partial [Tanacetum coccineum]
RTWRMVRLPTWQYFRAGGKDSGGGGKGLSMVELGLWDKTGVVNPVLPLLVPHGYKEVCNFRPCGVKGLGTWQFKSPRVISAIASPVLVSYGLGDLAEMPLVV